MKELLSILVLCTILNGCSNHEIKKVNVKQLEKVSLPQDTFALNGLWALPNYVDSIIEYKSISKYRMQWPTSFAILIEIENDTLRSYGSIYDIETKLETKGDTLNIFDKTANTQWILTLNKLTNKLELRYYDLNVEQVDTIVYFFEKRQDLEFLLDTLDFVHYTSTSFTNYFHKRLFSGTYEIIGEDKQVTFNSNGRVSGFKDFNEYLVDNYFGTYHPYNNYDNITFKRKLPENSIKNDWELFKWEFKGDTLILTQFNWNIINYKGKSVRGENWKLSNEQIKLKRL